jgi:hypothetical protein
VLMFDTSRILAEGRGVHGDGDNSGRVGLVCPSRAEPLSFIETESVSGPTSPIDLAEASRALLVS